MPHKKSELSATRQGEILILIAAVFGALLPVLVNPHSTSLAPIWIAAFSSTLALLPITIVMLKQKSWSDLRNRSGLFYSSLAGGLVGVIYYSLVHWGSFHTSPQNASIILCFEMFTAMALLHRRKNEKLSPREACGASLLFIAIALVFMPESSHPQSGDLVLLCASFITPIGNSFMKVARRSISSVSIMWIRSIISACLLSIIGFITTEVPGNTEISQASTVLLLNGVLILGISKILWVEGIYKIPIAKASALGAITPLMTFIFAWLILGKIPTFFQILALPLTIFGVLLIVTKSKRSKLDSPSPSTSVP